jgi:hypothetical protein
LTKNIALTVALPKEGKGKKLDPPSPRKEGGGGERERERDGGLEERSGSEIGRNKNGRKI